MSFTWESMTHLRRENHPLTLLQTELERRSHGQTVAMFSASNWSLRKYAKVFQLSLPKSLRKSHQRELLTNVDRAKYVFCGDYHTFPASQQCFIEIIDAYRSFAPDRKVVIAVEVFRSSDQSILDRFMRGLINVKTLLGQTNYAKNWGFSWNNFRGIFDFARRQNLPILGFNEGTRSKDPKSLEKRDLAMAERLKNIRAAHPGAVVFVLVGEHHIAKKHLLGSFEDAYVCLMSNINIAGSNNARRSASAILRDRETFVVQNQPIWKKWKSFLMWEELQHIQDYLEKGSPSDWEHVLLELCDTLMQFLNQKVSQEEIHGFMDLLLDNGRLSQNMFSDPSFIEKLTFYSGQILFSRNLVYADAFALRICQSLCGELANFIFDPYLEREQIKVWKKLANSKVGQNGRLQADKNMSRKIIKIFPTLQKSVNIYALKFPKMIQKFDEKSDYKLSRHLGKIIASQIFDLYDQGAIPHATLVQIFRNPQSTFATLRRVTSGHKKANIHAA